METTNTKNIPKATAVMGSTTSLVNNMEEDAAVQPSSSSQPNDESIVNQPQSTTNTYVLEISTMMLFFAWNLSGTVFQNQILYQSCTMNYNDSVCSDVIDNELVKVEVERLASKIFMGRGILESIIPAFISFLIAPWSDKFGRRPILLCAFFGYFLAYLILTIISIISTYYSTNPWYYLISFIPLSLLGGTCILITGIFCYISDVSSECNRAFRMARMEAAVFIGLLLGSLVSGQLYGLTSASAVFGCACLCTLLGFFFIFAFLKESIKNETDINGFCGKFKALFDWNHVVSLFRTCTKRRENNDRISIWIIIFALASTMFILDGSVTLSFMFMHDKFKWSVNDYNIYSAMNVIFQVIGNIFGMYVLKKKLGVPEIIIAMIGFMSAMVEYISTGLATASWVLYLASFVVMMKGVAVPMCRSYLAYLVPSNEIGKIYIVTTSMESLAPIAASPTYTLIYSYTMKTYPGAFNFFSAFIYLYCVLLTFTVFLMRRRSSMSYQQMAS